MYYFSHSTHCQIRFVLHLAHFQSNSHLFFCFSLPILSSGNDEIKSCTTFAIFNGFLFIYCIRTRILSNAQNIFLSLYNFNAPDQSVWLLFVVANKKILSWVVLWLFHQNSSYASISHIRFAYRAADNRWFWQIGLRHRTIRSSQRTRCAFAQTAMLSVECQRSLVWSCRIHSKCVIYKQVPSNFRL